MSDAVANKELVLRFWQSRPQDQPGFLTDDVVWHVPTSIGQRVFGGSADLRRAVAVADRDVGQLLRQRVFQ